MTQFVFIPSDERIVDAMIRLARASKSHRMIVAGCNSSEVVLDLHRRGCSRAATTKTCRVPCGQNDVAVITWREHSIKALATTLDWLVHFLIPAGILVVWIGPHVRTPKQALRLPLETLGFRIEAGICCESGVAIAARRIDSTLAAEAA